MTTDLLHTGAGGRTNLTAISLYIGSAVEDVLSVSCSCRALRWGVSPGSSVNVCTLTSVSLLSLCSSEAYYHEVLWMLCIREVAHKRMIRESFQTLVVCTDRLFVEQNGNTAQGWGGAVRRGRRGSPVECPRGDPGTHTWHYVPYYLCVAVS